MAMIESLEGRTLFVTVTAVQLAGPVTKGTTHSYLVTNSGNYAGTATETEYGPIRMNGKTVYKDETSTTNSVGQYSGVVGTYGLLNNRYGQTTYQSTSVGPGKASSRTIVGTQFDPAQTQLPGTMASGQTYTSIGTATESTRVGTAAATVRSYAYSVAQSLRAKATSVKTAVGTYRCFIVDTTVTAVVNGVTRTTAMSSYYSVGVGLVKRILVASMSGSNTKTSTEQSLIGFKVGKG
jgi:hypothetical protein